MYFQLYSKCSQLKIIKDIDESFTGFNGSNECFGGHEGFLMGFRVFEIELDD